MKRISPNDPDATRKLKECEKAVQKIRFEEAISVGDEEKRSVADSIDYRIIGIWCLLSEHISTLLGPCTLFDKANLGCDYGLDILVLFSQT